jgi:hypothetical protein
MGLDWNPGPKPQPNSEDEFRRLWRRLQSKWCWNRSAKLKRFEEVTITAFETLEAPRVGSDQRANEWAREAFTARADKTVSEEDFIQQMKDFYVLDLVPPCDGLPRYTNGYTGGYVERYAFRGQFLVDCHEIIGRDLLEQAYHSKLPNDTARYADALLGRAAAFARENSMDASKSLHTEDPDSIEYRLDVVLSAGRWCRFWSERGHWLEAYW